MRRAARGLHPLLFVISVMLPKLDLTAKSPEESLGSAGLAAIHLVAPRSVFFGTAQMANPSGVLAETSKSEPRHQWVAKANCSMPEMTVNWAVTLDRVVVERGQMRLPSGRREIALDIKLPTHVSVKPEVKLQLHLELEASRSSDIALADAKQELESLRKSFPLQLVARKVADAPSLPLIELVPHNLAWAARLRDAGFRIAERSKSAPSMRRGLEVQELGGGTLCDVEECLLLVDIAAVEPSSLRSLFGAVHGRRRVLAWGVGPKLPIVSFRNVASLGSGITLASLNQTELPWCRQVDRLLEFGVVEFDSAIEMDFEHQRLLLKMGADGDWRWARVDQVCKPNPGADMTVIAEPTGPRSLGRTVCLGADLQKYWEAEPAIRYMLAEVIDQQF